MGEQILKQIGLPAYLVTGAAIIGLAFYIHKSILEKTKLKLEIERLKRELGKD